MSTLRELELVQVSPRLLEVLRRQGIAELTEFQKEAVKGGITRRRSQILVTTDFDEGLEIAEIALLNRVVSDVRARGLVLCPNPHHAEKRAKSIGQRSARLGVETTIMARRRESIHAVSNLGKIVISTFKSFSIALKTQPSILEDVQVVLVDRLDLVGHAKIGPFLEKSIVGLMGENAIQFIGVSPPVADIEDLGSWLKAEIVKDTKQDIQRIFSVKAYEKLYESLTELTEYIMSKKGQVLLLCPDVSTTEKIALILAEGDEQNEPVHLDLTVGHQDELIELSRKISQHHPLCDITQRIRRTVQKGVGFLHGGLSRMQRRLLSNAWEDLLIPVLVAPTSYVIPSGLKASTVFVLGSYMKDDAQGNSESLSILSEWQMTDILLSAGRKGIDSRAFGVIVVDNEVERRRVLSKYFETRQDGTIFPILGEVDSSMDELENAQDLVLGEICSSSDGEEDPFKVLSRTFWAAKIRMKDDDDSLLQSLIGRRTTRSTLKRARDIPDANVRIVSVTPYKTEGLIRSESRDLWHHVVMREDEGVSCTCESWKFQGIRKHRLCKHLAKFLLFASRDERTSQYAEAVIRKTLTSLELLEGLERENLVSRRGNKLICTDLGKTISMLGIPIKDARAVQRVLKGDVSSLSEILLELVKSNTAARPDEWKRALELILEATGDEPEFCESDNPGIMENCFEEYHYYLSLLLRFLKKSRPKLQEEVRNLQDKLERILRASR